MEKQIVKKIKDDISIVIGGEAGQGIQTVEKLLTHLFKDAGFNVYATKEYMSRVRGGSNSTEIRVSSFRRNAFVRKIDILIPLDPDSIGHLGRRIDGDTIIFADKDKMSTDKPIIDVPFAKVAQEYGSPIFLNTVAVGLILGILSADREVIERNISSYFSKKGEDIIKKNVSAMNRGYGIAKDFVGPGKLEIDIKKNSAAKNEILISGSEAVSFGAVAGGCNFISAYPMTPSTGVLTTLSRYASEFGIIAEQSEDEISAVNMACGAWYAGARALVCTAGGGFSLMTEGVSLAAMTETPLVINVGMRPAPATGLPTRTEQGDLELVLYAGHGEFPRIVFAPGTIEEAFAITQKAFNLADKYQVPVFILSDQYLADTYYNVPRIEPEHFRNDYYVVETGKGYKRYSFSVNPDGVSPRGVPGGGGLVCADSDEHDEDGRITEDENVRKRMVDKRLGKLRFLSRGVMPPELTGPKEYSALVIGWGSTCGVIKEAIEKTGKKSVSSLHFKQVYPLHPFTAGYLKKAKKIILVENNATGQFGKILKLYTGVDVKNKILKYDGLPFSVEELSEEIEEFL
ncbi:MAG: 2-oxoacid:acceptor oxidoreductase subunit alpha [Endomicrobiales bacterium]|nr:2-oxoacid:acceptor oxidoreductase subunit alpha [Endomicrobiales bacterium]